MSIETSDIEKMELMSARKQVSSRTRSPQKRTGSGVKVDHIQSYSVPLQPASGENKASALRRSINRYSIIQSDCLDCLNSYRTAEWLALNDCLRKKNQDLQVEHWQLQQRERQRRNRLRALRLDPAWSQVRGGDQALEDIEHRRCYKEVVERERLIQYHMDREEMLSRVWQMPPLFERQARVISFRFFHNSITNQFK